MKMICVKLPVLSEPCDHFQKIWKCPTLTFLQKPDFTVDKYILVQYSGRYQKYEVQSFGMVQSLVWVSPGISQSNAHLGDSPLARASHCIMRTNLYTRGFFNVHRSKHGTTICTRILFYNLQKQSSQELCRCTNNWAVITKPTTSHKVYHPLQSQNLHCIIGFMCMLQHTKSEHVGKGGFTKWISILILMPSFTPVQCLYEPLKCSLLKNKNNARCIVGMRLRPCQAVARGALGLPGGPGSL